MDTPATIDAVRRLEAALLQEPQVDLRTAHLLHGGLSARTVFIPAGTLVTGALTALDNIVIVSGDITVTVGDGESVRLAGHNIIAARAGSKRVGLAHADTTWTTLHRTDCTDVAAAEDEMTCEADRLQTRQAALKGHGNELLD